MILGKMQRGLIGTQVPPFKPSLYNFLIPCDEGFTLAFNGVSKAIGRFTRDQFYVVKAILSKPNHPVGQVPGGIQIKQYLARNGFIVPANMDELALLRERNRSGIGTRDCFDLILMPTLDCNFNCFYCYETHRPVTMKQGILKRIIAWADQTIPLYKYLNLSWFGGEPLLELDTLVSLSDFFSDLCWHRGIGFHNMVTTNGYLLTGAVIHMLKNIEVKTLNVTVDGPPCWHNRFRTHKNGGETFERITDGIVLVARTIPDVRVNIRVNYNSDNFDAIPELFDTFPTDIRSRIFFLFRQIFGEKAERCAIADKTNREQTFYEKAEQAGYGADLVQTIFGPKETFCYADREGSLIINPEGEVFKCALSDFSRYGRLGKLDSDGAILWDIESLHRWQSLNGFDDPSCRKCRYLPLCMGGCRSQRLNNGRIEECTQPFEHTEHLLKQTYNKRKGP